MDGADSDARGSRDGLKVKNCILSVFWNRKWNPKVFTLITYHPVFPFPDGVLLDCRQVSRIVNQSRIYISVLPVLLDILSS